MELLKVCATVVNNISLVAAKHSCSIITIIENNACIKPLEKEKSQLSKLAMYILVEKAFQ